MSKASEELLIKTEIRLAKINEDIAIADEKISEWQERKRKLLCDLEACENKRILMIVNLNNISGTQLKELLSPKTSNYSHATAAPVSVTERTNENEDDE